MYKHSFFVENIQKGVLILREILFVFSIVFVLFQGIIPQTEEKEMSLILEVESTSNRAKTEVENKHPFIEVVATYDTLFQGIAIKGKAKHIEKVIQSDLDRKSVV